MPDAGEAHPDMKWPEILLYGLQWAIICMPTYALCHYLSLITLEHISYRDHPHFRPLEDAKYWELFLTNTAAYAGSNGLWRLYRRWVYDI